MAQATQSDEEMITGINITPLVDVVLVLLIILMVTASYIVSKSIPVDLPQGKTGDTVHGTVALTITKSGQWYLDGVSVQEPELRRHVRGAVRRSKEARALIAADGQVEHRQVVRLVDLLRQEGLTRFALDVDPRELGERP